MPWPLDERFRIPENRAILDFVQRDNPSAHDDVATVLTESAKGMSDAGWYCPDVQSYAYVVLHTQGNRIFGIAFGQGGLAYRLPPERIPEAVAEGGKVYPEIGDDWVMFEPWPPGERIEVTLERPKRWCKIAHDHAVAPKAQRSGR
jgi:hypothetical protein